MRNPCWNTARNRNKAYLGLVLLFYTKTRAIPVESVTVAFRIEKQVLDKFDKVCRERCIYARSEGLRKLVISAVKRRKIGNAC